MNLDKKAASRKVTPMIDEKSLESLTIDELKELSEKIDLLLKNRQTTQRNNAIEKINQILKDNNLSPEDAFPNRQQTKKRTTYRHPYNTAITWSGRGRKPNWLIDYIAAGNSPDDLISN
jgi:DNA-binding protein H-NS